MFWLICVYYYKNATNNNVVVVFQCISVATTEDDDPSNPHRQPTCPCKPSTGRIGGDQRGALLSAEEHVLPQTSTGAAEPDHCPRPRREAPSSRGYPHAVTSAVPGKAGAAIWPV